MIRIEEVIKAYKRFSKNYKTPSGSICIYPQFAEDLQVLLDFVASETYGLEEESNER